MTETAERVKSIVAEHLGVEREKVTPQSSFTDDLRAGSIDMVELTLAFEDAFDIEIPDNAVKSILTIADAVTFIDSRRSAGAAPQ